MPDRKKGSSLCKTWGIDVKQALYSKWGNWYGPIKSYPAALLDANGYFIVDSPDTLKLPGFSVGKQINIPKHLSSLSGYVRMMQETILLPEEVLETEKFSEGAVSKITVNKYERDKNARTACISYHGYICSACGINLEEIYGKVAHDFIHVHHLISISSIGEKYEINPINYQPCC